MKLDRKLLIGLSLLASTLPLTAIAQANAPAPNAPGAVAGPSDGGPPAPAALDGPTTTAATPPSAPPQGTPKQPAPPQAAPAQPGPGQQPGDAQAQGAPQQKLQETPPGQWVYTQQYGWLWMPYGEAFTQVPQDDQGQPYMYVYGPSLGWSWVVAPWVWGWGPYPYYGVYGPSHYWWYGWGPRWYGYAGWYGGYYGHGYYGHGYPYAGWHGAVRPAPPRPGYAPGHVSGPVHVGGAPHGARPAVGRGGGRR